MIVDVKGLVAHAAEDILAKIDIHPEEKYTSHGKPKAYEDTPIDLASLTRPEVEKLLAAFEEADLQGTKVVMADIRKYLKAAESETGYASMTARNCRQASWMLERLFASLPHHIVFSPDKYRGGSMSGFWLQDIDYQPKFKRDGRDVPESLTVRVCHIENDRRSSNQFTCYRTDVYGKTPEEILSAEGYVVETPALMAKLAAETELYYATIPLIGKKYLGVGVGLADLDDATKSDGERRNFWSRSSHVVLDNFGVPSPLVVDVLHETDTTQTDARRASEGHVDLYRWEKQNSRFFSPADDVLARLMEEDEDTDPLPEYEIPIHPLVPCFDLKRHMRMRVHINNMTEYGYREGVAEGLILPKRDWDLIQLLVDQSENTFQDVVEGKGSSMNILSGGAPGTGKTLTAEVIAEFKGRPLYSIQCSQLGLNPASVEGNLAIILQRANRWNAVLLLDEADVYIRERGADLAHNAIVGVFLRMLEYATCILFMTTNLPDSVDDAIASRCIVALHYEVPGSEEQARIWRSLADLNNITITDKTIKAFANAHPKISGRDVKNLLKLASFVSEKSGKPVDADTLEFALQYKPTADVS